MPDLPPSGGEESVTVLLATIRMLQKQVQKEAERRREAERALAMREFRDEAREAA